jgi:hypothetical protein
MTTPTTRIRTFTLRRGLLVAVLAGFAISLLAVAPAEAGERVRFKNGHTIVAMKVSIEGDFVYLTMKDGSRVGFPKELVADLEEGVSAPKSRSRNTSGYGGRGPSMTDLSGYKKHMRQSGQGLQLSGNTANYDPNHTGPRTYGFSYRGSGYNGGVKRPPRQNGINVFEFIESGGNVPQVQDRVPNATATDKTHESGGEAKRLMPQFKPPEGGGKKKKEGLKKTNPNLPPTKR